MNVTVIGGGNIGTLMAAEMAHNGHSVTVYTASCTKCWDKEIQVYNSGDEYLFSGKLLCVTDDMKIALENAQIIWVTVPAQMFDGIAEKMYPYVKEGQAIGVVPGSGGAEFAFRKLILKGCVLFGMQRVHSIARIKERGRSVYMLGKKDSLQIGSIPQCETNNVAKSVGELLNMKTEALPNYLCVTLTPSNPILHTTRLYSMFRTYKNGDYYPRNFLFYQEWSNDSSEILFKCDAELQSLCRVIPVELSNVKSLLLYYESDTVEKFTEKIHSINAFKGLTSPMVQLAESKWIPDFTSRYFTSDFSYGLKIILDLCELFEVDAPNIRMIWEWYKNTSPDMCNEYFKLGLNKQELLQLYV